MKKILFSLISLILIGLASASVTLSPSPEYGTGIIYSDQVMFKVQTSTESLCRFSKQEDAAFAIMDSFDENLQTVHKKTLINLQDGVYKYYVKCRDYYDNTNTSTESTENFSFIISNAISAQIILEDEILNAGKHELKLITTKVPQSTPILRYSYDGISYDPIVLYGSSTSWKGFLIIPSSAGEEIGSFKFEARDFESRLGTSIIGDNIFLVDTMAPSTPSSIEAEGSYGEVKLEWILSDDEEIEKINIYRSEDPGVDLTDFYEELEGDDEIFYDSDIENGETYYYKISFEDKAGNKGSLSREVQATTLLGKTSSSNGLSPSLLGSVDALLSEINLAEIEITNSNNMINSLNSEEKAQMKYFKVTDSLSSATSELSLLKKTVEAYKLTDTTKEVLDGKLSSSQVRLNVIKKKIPNSISLLDSDEKSFQPTEDSLRTALLEYSSELSPNEISKQVKKSLSKIEESNLKINSAISIFEIIYLDGSKESKTIIEHSLDSSLEREEGSKFLIRFPSSSIDLSSLSVKNLDYATEQEGLISFETDNKKIIYTLDQELDAQILNEITISLIALEESQTQLTGYFLSEVPSGGSIAATLSILLISGLVAYLLYMRQQRQKQVSLDFLERAREVRSLQKQGQNEKANKLYESLKSEYSLLSKDQKRKVFEQIKHLTKK